MRLLALAFIAAVSLVACGPSSASLPISQSAAVKSALAAVELLAEDHARATSQPAVTGFTVQDARLTTVTSRVSDSRGHQLTVNPAPSKAWVVGFAAPPQGIWGSVSALAEVDATSGVVAGSGLWAIPADRPSKRVP